MISRRSLLVSAGSLLFGAGCKRASAAPSFCDETSSLTADERALRTTLAYVERAADPTKSCTSCQQWVGPTSDGACGSCKLLKGPIHPAGSCKAFAPKG